MNRDTTKQRHGRDAGRRGLSRRTFFKATVGTVALAGALPAERIVVPRIARAALKLEKEDLKFGFMKLTDMAPIAIAKELNFFEDEGLYVTTEPQANWKVLLDRVITGELDGAHMLAGQPLGATIGFGTKAHVITPFSMDLNGNGITVSNAVWEEMKKHIPKDASGKFVHPIKADALKKVVEKYKSEGKPFNLGMVFPLSTHNYELRYWLAAGGIHPGLYSSTDISGQIMGDVLISVTPPPQMPATSRSRHDPRLLRRRAVEPGGRVQGHRRSGHHRLRDSEEQSREGVRDDCGLPEKASEHRARGDQGADPRRHVA